MSSSKRFHPVAAIFAVVVAASCGCVPIHAQTDHVASKMPWSDKTLSPDQRADMVLGKMTLDEKIQMVHGQGWGVLRPALLCLRDRTSARGLCQESNGSASPTLTSPTPP